MNYILHDKTLAIASHKSNYFRTKIYERNEVVYREEDPLTIIRNSCKHYGYKLSGWNKLVEELLQRQSKLPIPISPTKRLFFLPTTSYRNEHCIWISFYQVAHYLETNKKLTIVFNDGKTVDTDVSLNQFKLQMKRTGLVIAHFYDIYCK